jgi:hypothetical protein
MAKKIKVSKKAYREFMIFFWSFMIGVVLTESVALLIKFHPLI